MIVSMSSSVTRVVDPLDLQDASRERLLAEIGLLQHRYSLTDPGRLEARIRELESQLESSENLQVAEHDAQVARYDAQVAEHDAQVAQHDAQVANHDKQVTQLKKELDDLKMSLLHTRDYARGCAAELGEARTFFEIHIADRDRKVRQARKKNQQIYATRTWKMGRLVMLPIRIVRRIIKVG
jgi:chromosome segregation ATPase